MVELKTLKNGDFFKLNNKENATIYVKGEYDRSSKKYSCYKYYDVNDERFFNGSKKVFVEFEF